MARFICVSDTHNQSIPKFHGDVLIHAGDMTTSGTPKEIRAAAEEIASYPCRDKIVVPGNHDILFETNEAQARSIFDQYGIKVLINQCTEVAGVKIWGSPNVPKCWGAFGFDGFTSKHPFDSIPNDTEILITHCPPRYIRDSAPGVRHLGSEALARRVFEVKPKYHIFGHIHMSQGFETQQGIVFINAAIVSERYQPLNPPIAFNFGLPGQYELW